jgi:hypothetical protein
VAAINSELQSDCMHVNVFRGISDHHLASWVRRFRFNFFSVRSEMRHADFPSSPNENEFERRTRVANDKISKWIQIFNYFQLAIVLWSDAAPKISICEARK